MQEIAASERRLHLWESPHTLWGHLSAVDHKIIGKRYLVTAFVFLLLGGVEAVAMRLQLTHSDNHLLSPESYDQLFCMRGITMIFTVVIRCGTSMRKSTILTAIASSIKIV